ncbi:MAG TPA: alcohol dehydrogenase catalytic domain-containing protein [Trinickia sp.]|uniref:alcohol dehydrogenase catalytic domain-containing protein n=1 Tax=Trinickia sp. TaxID=2571163 RepID=UPI002C5284B1|nr:alcohol dehydrogenase catalytic domain-containing protein [Trinickia sp.]HTI18847.1 alcohol dehydrogenase catalytic domain-containing protein [Trinickia sp.]
MKAMVLRAFGQPLELAEMPRPQVGPADVLVRVRACGIGLTVVNLLATPGRVTAYPRIPGHEIAGDVVEVGDAVRTVKTGQRVTNHFYLTCGQCKQCRAGRETLCLNQRGNIGAAIDGGYAEYVALPERNTVPIPDGVSYVDAAVASDAIATPYHACHKEARLGPGDSVLIVGAGGGVGIHMVQMARLCGARVLAADIGDDKLALAQAHGADEVIDARKANLSDAVKALTQGFGVDAAIDIVASRATLEAALQSLAVGGRLVIIGAQPQPVYGIEPGFTVNPLEFLHRGLELHSSRYVNVAEIAHTLELVRLKRIKPVVTQTFALERVEEAHDLIRRNATAGRLAMVIS